MQVERMSELMFAGIEKIIEIQITFVLDVNHAPFISGPPPFEYTAHASDSAIEWMNWVRG